MIQQPQTIKNQFKHLDKVIIIHQPAEKKSLPHICWNAYKPYTPPPKKKHQHDAFFEMLLHRSTFLFGRFCGGVAFKYHSQTTIGCEMGAWRWGSSRIRHMGWDLHTHKIYPSCGYLFHLICIYMCINKYVCVLYMEHLGFDIFETLGILESHPRKTSI